MQLTILHDTHNGAIRAEGTTTVSQWALRQHLNAELKRLLPEDGDLMILGDLFDTANVAIFDLLAVYQILADWLIAHPNSKLYNVRGNHDASKTSNVLSSFDFLGELLKRVAPAQYVHIVESQMTPYGYVIPHYRNQDLFNLELERVPECPFLFLHCNVDNGFAAQSDQSLNISLEQVEKCKAQFLVVAHEHHSRLVGKVILPGNQIASSVADWLAPNPRKQRLVITDGAMNLEPVAVRAEQYAEIDWRAADWQDRKFLRIVGTATAEEASAVVNAVNAIRKKSEAFVVSNAVKIMSDDMTEMVQESLEAVQAFDIMQALREIFTETEMQVLEKLNA